MERPTGGLDRPDTAAARSADQQSKLPSHGYAVIGDWLWAGAGPQPWGRLSLADGRREDFPMPREQGNSFQPVYLQPLAAGPRDGGNAPTEGRILVGDGYGLWVVTVPPAK